MLTSRASQVLVLLLLAPTVAEAAGAARRMGHEDPPESRYLARLTSEFTADVGQLRVLTDAGTGELQGLEVRRWVPLPNDPLARYTVADLQAAPQTIPVDGTLVTFPPGAEISLPGANFQGRRPFFIFLEGQPPFDRATARIFYLRDGKSAKKPSYREFRAELVRDPEHAGQGYRLFAESARAAGFSPTDWLFLLKNKNFLGITIGIKSIEPRLYPGPQP